MADTTTTNYGLTKPGNLEAAGAGLWGPKLNTDFDTIDSELAKPRIIKNAPTIGATTTFDLSLARVFTLTVSQITTIAFSNVPTSTYAVRIRVLLTNGAAFAITWPASVSWFEGSAPTFRTAGIDEVELVTTDGGTTWLGSLRGETRFQLGTGAGMARSGLVLYQNVSLTTTSTSDVSLGSYSLPANALAVNGQRVRITLAGGTVTQAAAASIRFGATTTIAVAPAAGQRFYTVVTVARTGAATQVWCDQTIINASVSISRNTAAETLSGAVLIDFRGSVTAGGTLTLDHLLIEYLAS